MRSRDCCCATRSRPDGGGSSLRHAGRGLAEGPAIRATGGCGRLIATAPRPEPVEGTGTRAIGGFTEPDRPIQPHTSEPVDGTDDAIGGFAEPATHRDRTQSLSPSKGPGRARSVASTAQPPLEHDPAPGTLDAARHPHHPRAGRRSVSTVRHDRPNRVDRHGAAARHPRDPVDVARPVRRATGLRPQGPASGRGRVRRRGHRHPSRRAAAARGTAVDGLPVRDGDTLLMPPTGARNDEYRRTAPGLFAAASRAAIEGSGYSTDAVTHVVTVSCTGMFAPGPDYHLVRDLGLSPTVERYHLGFIGCAQRSRRCASRRGSSGTTPPRSCSCLHRAVLAALADLVAPRSDRRRLGSPTARAPRSWHPGSLARGPRPRRLRHPRDRRRREGHGVDRRRLGLRDDVDARGAAHHRARDLRDRRRRARDLADVDAWAVHPGGRSILDRVESALGWMPRPWRPRGRCCAGMAICRAPRCCSSCATCSPTPL